MKNFGLTLTTVLALASLISCSQGGTTTDKSHPDSEIVSQKKPIGTPQSSPDEDSGNSTTNANNNSAVLPGTDVPAVGVNKPNGVTSGSPIGVYNGYVIRSDKTLVPLTLDIQVKRNASTGSSQLQVNMRVGMYGGVIVGSNNATFDLTDGLLTASFPANQGSSVELNGYIDGDSLQDGFITGTNSGQQAVVVSKSQPSSFKPDSTANYAMAFSTSRGAVADLTIIPRLEAQASAQTSDLPLVPALAVSIRMSGLSFDPASATQTYYDPLNARMDVVAANGRFHFDNVALTSSGATPKVLKGYAVSGSAPVANIVATYTGNKVSVNSTESVETRYYNGYYTSSRSNLKLSAAAKLEYEGVEGTNPGDVIFATFPKMSLKMYICQDETLGSGEFGRYIMDSVSMNVVMGSAMFEEVLGDKKIDYEAKFSNSWTGLDGILRTPREQAAAAGATSRVTLKAVSNKAWRPCALNE